MRAISPAVTLNVAIGDSFERDTLEEWNKQ